MRNKDGSITEDEDVVTARVLSRTGETADKVLKHIHVMEKEIREKILPKDVTYIPFIDRSRLMAHTTHTVMDNMLHGMLLVVAILLFFLGNIRSALVVAVTIPFSLLVASILLDLRNIPANLLSLGALDCGMVVDGAVVMIENIFRHKHLAKERGENPYIIDLIRRTTREVEKPIVYSVGIIVLAYLPIFTLQRVEGSCLRLRPIMMTALVATFGLLPAALSHEIGSDSQRPMAIVIVGGLLADLIIAFFLLPTLYAMFAKTNDKLHVDT